RARPPRRPGGPGRPREAELGALALVRDDPPLEARMTTYSSTMDTPAGGVTALVDGDGALLASGWTSAAHGPPPPTPPPLPHGALREGAPQPPNAPGQVSRAIRAYPRGDLTAPDRIAVRQHNDGAFLPAAWKALREVPAGQPLSYRELATRAGNDAAIRAAAQ